MFVLKKVFSANFCNKKITSIKITGYMFGIGGFNYNI